MAYLDGSPSPEDGKTGQINSINVTVDEPEAMIAALLLAIYRINGRRIDTVHVDWIDLTSVDSPVPDQRPKTVNVDSTMFHNFGEEGFKIG